MRLSLGPAPTNWGAKRLTEFYHEIAQSPVDRVYLGEIVCPKRDFLKAELVLEIQTLLRKAGKEVVFSTYVLPTSSHDLAKLRKLYGAADEIEVNNIGVLAMWRRDFPNCKITLGPYLDLYNTRSITLLKSPAVTRVVLPVDMQPEAALAVLKENGAEFEMTVAGRVSIAFSWRCYTARRFDRMKKDCRTVCSATREIHLATLDGDHIFTVNGPAVFTGARTDFRLADIGKYRDAGLSHVRIEPLADGTIQLIDLVKRRLETG